MNDEINNKEYTDDIELEMNDSENAELGSKAKIKDLREELQQAKEEAKANLDGWQRAQADMANYKRENADALKRAVSRAKEAIIEDIIPVLDSFDMAMSGDTWQHVDTTWRSGMQGVHNQLLSVLESNDITRYGAVGEVFDHNLHEALQETTEGDLPSHTITAIIRSGYRSPARVIRPAQVVVKG